jgi:adenosylcobinamide-GDP ribazoletransferase
MKRATRDQPVPKPDMRLFAAGDFPAALGLLTRLPVRVDGARAMVRGAAAVWAYPLVGVVVGGCQALAMAGLLWLGIGASITAALVLALGIIITGAMHEDGLADSADGLWGGWEPERRLAIMKDSHIGSYGVIALMLGLLIRWMALAAIAGSGDLALVLVAVGGISRAAMVGLLAWLPPARDKGLGQSVARPALAPVMVALVIAVALALVFGDLRLVLVAGLTAWACGLIAKAKIGGQTGDILGATQQITEIAMLIALASMAQVM